MPTSGPICHASPSGNGMFLWDQPRPNPKRDGVPAPQSNHSHEINRKPYKYNFFLRIRKFWKLLKIDNISSANCFDVGQK